MANNSANEWYISFLANRSVEIKRKIEHNSTSDGYVLRVGQLFSNQINLNSFYRINAFFYDLTTSQMFGKPCRTNWLKSQDKQIPFFEELFFHCPKIDDKILLIIEFVERETDTTPMRSIGWSKQIVQPLNQSIIEFLDAPSELSLNKVDVYSGTPKILIFGGGETSGENIIGTVESQIFSHSKLLEVVNFFPDFCIVSDKDDIPGIKKYADEPSLYLPIKEASINASIDDISLIFGPDTNKLEKTIMDEIFNDWALRENKNLKKEIKTSIIERRLKIGIHNGYCYLSEPLSINLIPSNSNILKNNSLIRKRRAMSSNDLRNGPISLFVNSRVSIPNIIEDPRIAIIFLVEYTFLHEDEQRCSQPVLIGWGAWKPFANVKLNSSRHNIQATVSLVGGPRPNPEDLLCFRNLIHLHRTDDSFFTESQPQISINFTFYSDQLTIESGPSTHRADNNLSSRSNYKNDKKKQEKEEEEEEEEEKNVEKLKKGFEKIPDILPKINTARSISSEEELKSINNDLIKSIDQNIEKEEEIVLKKENEEINSNIYDINYDEIRPTNFPRSVHSLVSKLPFPVIKDRNNELPITEDVSQKIIINTNQEKFDRLDQSNIYIQFIGFKQLSSADQQPIFKMFFTINFFRFPELITESLLLKQMERNEPAIFTRLDKNGNQSQESINSPGFIAKYQIDSDEEKIDFINYLSTELMTIDLWNSDSLCHIGSTNIPLKNLLRRGREAVQIYIQCPVIEPSLNSNKIITNSLLYLRIVNVGNASANLKDKSALSLNVSSVTRKLESTSRLSDEGPHTYRIHAKPLPITIKKDGETSGGGGLDRYLTAHRLDIQQRHEEIFNEESLEKIKQWNQLKNNFNFEDRKKISQKFIFEEELAAYKKLRFESKQAKLLEAVFKGITTFHKIRPSFGERIFFEFPLSNVQSRPINCVIEIDDEALKPILDEDEWRFLKSANKLNSEYEKNLMREVDGKVEIYLKPGETINIPFVYDAFYFPNDHFDFYTTKIVFRQWDNQEPMSILDLHVYRRNQLINKSITLIAESTTNFQKQLVIRNSPKERRILSTRCSDPSVRTTIRNNSLQQLIAFSTYSGDNGDRKTFLILMYSDHYQSRLLSVWKITLLAFLRVDIRGVIGQTTKFKLAIQNQNENEDSNDLYKIYSSSKCLNIETTILTGNHPVFAIECIPNFIGLKHFLISIVNTNINKLRGSYIIAVNSDEPKITQKFVVNVPINSDEITKKKILIRNPYGIPRTFRLSTSRNDIIQLTETLIHIPAMSSKYCELMFSKISHRKLNIEVLLYIANSETNIQEEAYSILIKYF